MPAIIFNAPIPLKGALGGPPNITLKKLCALAREGASVRRLRRPHNQRYVQVPTAAYAEPSRRPRSSRTLKGAATPQSSIRCRLGRRCDAFWGGIGARQDRQPAALCYKPSATTARAQNRNLTAATLKPKLASGVRTQGQRACYRLEPFQVRERTGENVAVYDGVRRADLFTTTSGTMTPRLGDISSRIQ